MTSKRYIEAVEYLFAVGSWRVPLDIVSRAVIAAAPAVMVAIVTGYWFLVPLAAIAFPAATYVPALRKMAAAIPPDLFPEDVDRTTPRLRLRRARREDAAAIAASMDADAILANGWVAGQPGPRGALWNG